MKKRFFVAVGLLCLTLSASAQMTPEEIGRQRQEIKAASSDSYQALSDQEFELALQHANRGLALIKPGYRTHENWRMRLLAVPEAGLYYEKAEALLGLGRREEALEAYRMMVTWEKRRYSHQEVARWDITGHGIHLLRYAKALAEAGRLEDAVAVYYAALRSSGFTGGLATRVPYRVVFHECQEGITVPLTAENVINASNLALAFGKALPVWERERVYGESIFGIVWGPRKVDPEYGEDYEIPDALFPGLPYMHLLVATRTQRPSHYGFSMALSMVQHEEDRQAIRDLMEFYQHDKTNSQDPFRRDLHEWRQWAMEVRHRMPVLEEHRQKLEDDPEWVDRLVGRVDHGPNG